MCIRDRYGVRLASRCLSSSKSFRNLIEGLEKRINLTAVVMHIRRAILDGEVGKFLGPLLPNLPSARRWACRVLVSTNELSSRHLGTTNNIYHLNEDILLLVSCSAYDTQVRPETLKARVRIGVNLRLEALADIVAQNDLRKRRDNDNQCYQEKQARVAILYRVHNLVHGLSLIHI